MAEQPDNTQPENKRDKGVVLSTIKSVLAAFLGVQSKKNWEKDMETPSPLRFIFGGLVLGFLFFATIFLVTWIISSYIV
ncbi:DUF2970 domain-containing protein [Natronospirillum operosum]|uniref:DUF2970 domain-containing protein n=1 Tax=Natronospirillum operosum TaxID=2759953 RepID=A0A4Z0WJV4_9GAMM|nr:DUF2970 domain-containing protein [Natronospirillum operosum]TGG95843.1 DUF2970 domain-containing protein [Natronospirillum operosum]